MPQISIIVPFHNPGRYFLPAIQSVFAQTFTDWELLLMDDGSTDGSVAFARSIQDERVRVFSDGLNLKINIRLNQLIDLARAPYIVRMDADDLIHPDKLKIQYELLRQYDSNTVVGTGTYSIDTESKVGGIRFLPNVQHAGFAARQDMLHASIMASAEWFRRYRYSENVLFYRAEDAELYVRSTGGSRFINIQQALYFYRERGDFSLEKYIGSSLSVVALALRIAPESRLRALYEIAKIGVKTWIVIFASFYGFVELLVANRSRTPTPQERQEAEDVIAYLSSVPVPCAAPPILSKQPASHSSVAGQSVVNS